MDKIDIFKTYKTRDPYFFKAGMMLLMCSLFAWLTNGKDNYLNLGFGFLFIYLIQYFIETYVIKKKDDWNAK